MMNNSQERPYASILPVPAGMGTPYLRAFLYLRLLPRAYRGRGEEEVNSKEDREPLG